MDADFDPYYIWLGIPPEEQPPDHYRLLGVSRFESNPDAVANAADRQMAHIRTLQTGKHGHLSQRLLKELAAAKICLLSAEEKKAYEAALGVREAVPPQPPATPAAPPVVARPSAQPPCSVAPSGQPLVRPHVGRADAWRTRLPKTCLHRVLQGDWLAVYASLLLVGLVIVWGKARYAEQESARQGPQKHSEVGSTHQLPPSVPKAEEPAPVPDSPPASATEDLPVGTRAASAPPADAVPLGVEQHEQYRRVPRPALPDSRCQSIFSSPARWSRPPGFSVRDSTIPGVPHPRKRLPFPQRHTGDPNTAALYSGDRAVRTSSS